MISYYLFLKRHFQPVFFGWSLTYFSSFGQTFLISLFVPFILSELSFSKTEFGSYYALATVTASLILLRFGHIIDERPVRPFTYKTIALLMFSCVGLGFVWHPYMLFIVLIGLRLGGQGLMSHISMSVMSRNFVKNRGKALSLSTLGYSMGEMTFPVLIGLIIAFTGWRFGAIFGAVILLFYMLSLRWVRIESLDVKPPPGATSVAPLTGKRKFIWNMVRETRFFIIAPPSFAVAFTITGFFFYQYIMAEQKSWPVEIYTSLFAGYGVIRLMMSLYGGILTDKYTSIKLFVVQLIPMTTGLLALAFLPGLWAAAAFLALTGVTVGIAGVTGTAILAEVYGTQRMGQVRSVFSVMGVISTALAPLVFGFLLDRGIQFEELALWCASLLILITLHNTRIFRMDY